MMYLFLIPFVEHLTERTKNLFIDKVLPEKFPIYLSHHVTPLFALGWAFYLILLYGWLVGSRPLVDWEKVIAVAGGSIVWYEISSLWKKQKRASIPLKTKGLEKVFEIEKEEIE